MTTMGFCVKCKQKLYMDRMAIHVSRIQEVFSRGRFGASGRTKKRPLKPHFNLSKGKKYIPPPTPPP